MFIKPKGWYSHQWVKLRDDEILNVTYRTAAKVMFESNGGMEVVNEAIPFVARQVAMHPESTRLHDAIS